MSHAAAPDVRFNGPNRALRDAAGIGGFECAGTGLRDDLAAPSGGAVLRPSALDVFITEPIGCASQARYLVSHVTRRSVRLYHTQVLWFAQEVCNAWRRGDFVFEKGDLRLLPNPPPRVAPAPTSTPSEST